MPNHAKNHIIYEQKQMKMLSDDEVTQCLSVYNHNYGRWAYDKIKNIKRLWHHVKFPKKRFNNMQKKDNYNIIIAKDNDIIIGYAVYFRGYINEKKDIISWVASLVVSKKYRKQGIATKMLQAVWTFSTDYAWGLATPNPMTVYTLEKATRRVIDLSYIAREKKLLKDIQSKFKDYLKKDMLTNDYISNSLVNTEFPIINYANRYIRQYERISNRKWQLGKFIKGYEWIALTFQSQTPKEITKDELINKIEYDSMQIKDAYSRMNMNSHKWAQGTQNEISFILNFISENNIDINKDDYIYDFGCGIGRHCIELYDKGYTNITGYDYSDKHFQNINKTKSIIFEVKDIAQKNLILKHKAKLILCLYDVIGSSYNDEINNEILKNIYNNLEDNGIAVISVMNMEYTMHLNPLRVNNIRENPKYIQELPARNIMESTGEVFNPKYLLIDEQTPTLVYRKEQFENGNLPIEYIMVDRRYKKAEIEELVARFKFNILYSAYTSAGHFEKSYGATDDHAKEILLILKKRHIQ